MNATDAFQFTINLAEDWRRDLRRFRDAVVEAATGRRTLEREWQELFVSSVDVATMSIAAARLTEADTEVGRSIDLVKRALAEGRLDDAIIAVKQWDLHFEKLIAPVVGGGPRDSKALPGAYIVLKPGTEAINKALDIRYETIGTITASEAAYRDLLNSSSNPWR